MTAASNGENKSAPASKSWGVRAVLKKIAVGVGLASWGVGLWRWYMTYPRWMLSVVGMVAVLLGLHLLVIHNSAIMEFLWKRGHYRTVEFFINHLTVKPNENVQAITILGDIYFYGLGREKDWPLAAIQYELALLLDTAATKAIFKTLDPEMAEAMLHHWPAPACLLNLQEIAANDNPQADRFLTYWAQSVLPHSPSQNNPSE
ncbi:MAG: SEL1-like repeat protein [Candidatus Adiutrix sp.]|jgi:hypothetical protein|nr:SEL1-like repeat protein [Candidatus Adiutrix sp.]